MEAVVGGWEGEAGGAGWRWRLGERGWEGEDGSGGWEREAGGGGCEGEARAQPPHQITVGIWQASGTEWVLNSYFERMNG